MSRDRKEPSAVASVATLLGVVATGFTFLTLQALRVAETPITEVFGGMCGLSWYSYASFCLMPLIFPLVSVFSPWPQSVWDYLYTFASASLYSYPIPAIAISAAIFCDLATAIWERVEIAVDIRLTIFVLILFIVTPAFLSYTMASAAQRERLAQPQYYVDFSPLALNVTIITTFLILLKSMRMFSTNPLVSYATLPTAAASLAFAFLGLATNVAATRISGLVWFIVGLAVAFATYFLEPMVVLL